jgi:putative addiction module component (TIGR02574 family)
MSRTLESLKAEVMSLAPADRARLLDQLIVSLDRDEDTEEAWNELALKRENDIESGSIQGVPLEDVVARLEARFPG